ncbi:MAG: DUF5117 domain-containing protein [Leptolyngbyaceae cyanobacterium RU_5_1]|nr:DUF5117 domain-containing protein [Leptolyngbyaceae cyanobacterium RU_5_1]
MKKGSLVVAFIISLLLVGVLANLQQASSESLTSRAVGHHSPNHSLHQPLASSNAYNTSKQRSPQPSAAPAKLASTTQHQQIKLFEQTVRNTQRLDGLFALYRDRASNKLYAEIKPEQLNTHFLCTITLESGLGEQRVYSGLPLADFLFYFRRVNNTLQFAVANVYFRTRANDPLQRSVRRSFSDSVLASLPITAYHPQRKTYLVELDSILLDDFPGITPLLASALGSPYTIDKDKSHLGLVKSFPLNVELESVYSFTGSGSPDQLPAYVTSLPDHRTFNLRVRSSWSQLPTHNGYRPRKADDRVGYFITAFQNLSDDSPDGPFTRYINRWHLEKQEPTAPLSPPKKPIVFWIENTVPLDYREAVRDGVLMWNQAFEKAGFKDAIQVQQMPDKASWDPADIRYNTIRWITSFDQGFLGMGPSRVNPLTGEILDADILIDSGFVYYLKQQYRSIAERNPMRWVSSLATLIDHSSLCSYGMTPRYLRQRVSKPGQSIRVRATSQSMGTDDLCYGLEAAQQFSMGALSLSMLHNASPKSTEMKQYVQEFLRMLVAHEVGHTLGLRHNFRASAMLSPVELNNPTITHRKGLVGSVMDYSAVNIAPQGISQGDFLRIWLVLTMSGRSPMVILPIQANLRNQKQMH